jgi:protein-tyrosine phosphatase
MEPRQEDQAGLDESAVPVTARLAAADEDDAGDRVLSFEGVKNFRDYGGYSCAGGRLKRGLLFRSAQHRDATESDLDRIAALDLASVIDLRGRGERTRAPCARPPGFAAQIFFVDGDTTGIAPHLEAARTASGAPPSAQQVREAMIQGYRGMAYRRHLLPMLQRYFAVLAEVPGPSLIHCMAGKDRTGLAVALFHAAMGVHHDDIVADYLMTNLVGHGEQRIAAGARHVRAGYSEALGDDAVRVLMTVDPAFIDAAFAAIADRSGSIEAYLGDVLGITPARRNSIAARLLA